MLVYGVKYGTMRDIMLKSSGQYQKLKKVQRTIEENIRLSQRPKSRKEYNVSNCPLFPSIPITNVVIDNLHMFLRVCDVLIDLLIIRLRFEDAIDKVKKFTKFDTLKYKHVYAYQQFVTGLGISGFEFLHWSDVKGSEVSLLNRTGEIEGMPKH